MLDRARETDPVADLGAAGIEFLARQGLDASGVVALQHVDKAAVERLVDDKMRQPAGADDADPLVLRIALDGGADRLAELVAAPRRRLVRRVVGVDADRHDRHDILHDPLVHKANRVAFAFTFGRSARGGDVELAVDEFIDQMPRQAGIDGVVARRFLFIPTRRRPPSPIRVRNRLHRHVGDGFAVIDEDAGHVVVMIKLVLVVADDDQRVELCLAQKIPEPRHRALDRLMPRPHALRRDLIGDAGRRVL